MTSEMEQAVMTYLEVDDDTEVVQGAALFGIYENLFMG
jgi:hypothetical protein